MKVTTRAIYDIETGALLHEEFFLYDGPVAECGSLKGRGRRREEKARAKRLADQQERLAKEAEAVQRESRGRAEPFVQSLEATAPGQLSPYSQATYASSLEDIIRTYRSLRESGLAALQRSGFARAPSGFRGSFMSTAARGEQEASGRAFRGALQDTYGQGLQALQYRSGQQQFYDPTRRIGAASDLGQRRYGMQDPSIFGDIMSAVSLAAAPFTGGASLAGLAGKGLKGLGGLFKGPAASTASLGGGWGGRGR